MAAAQATSASCREASFRVQGGDQDEEEEEEVGEEELVVAVAAASVAAAASEASAAAAFAFAAAPAAERSSGGARDPARARSTASRCDGEPTAACVRKESHAARTGCFWKVLEFFYKVSGKSFVKV